MNTINNKLSCERERLVNEKTSWEKLINNYSELSINFKMFYKKDLEKGDKEGAKSFKWLLKHSKCNLKYSQQMLCETKHRLAEIETELN